MITDKILGGGTIALRQIELSDCTDSYVEWLNDPDVNQYLETRWYQQSLDTIKNFVNEQRTNNHSLLFAITLLADKDRHIGNIKIGPINKHHHHADVSYFIGDKSLWRHGIATKAINLVSEFGFSELKLHKIEAGVYAEAIASWKALEKNSFTREAVFREHVCSHGQYIDVYRYGLLESEFTKIQHKEM